MKLVSSILPFIILSFSYGQKIAVDKQKPDSLTSKKFKLVNEFLNLSSKDILADIGTGTGYSLIPIANECPDCKFAAEDIDSLVCNRRILLTRIIKTGNKTNIGNFTFYYGTEKTTNLPPATYTKILIFDVIHEMAFKTEMLSDIKRILQKGGSIFIEEILVHKKVKKDRVCNFPFLTETEFKQLLIDSKFLIKKENITFDTGDNKYMKIFECAPSD